MRRYLNLIVMLFALVAFSTGCKTPTLEPGGAYAQPGQQPDMLFYAVDASFDIAYSALDGAFRFERDNRAMLWRLSPEIKHTLDRVRPEAWRVAVDYAKARESYKANPTPAGLTVLQRILADTQRISTAVIAVLPKP